MLLPRSNDGGVAPSNLAKPSASSSESPMQKAKENNPSFRTSKVLSSRFVVVSTTAKRLFLFEALL